MTSRWPFNRFPTNPWDLASLAAAAVPALFIAAMFLTSPIVPPGADSAHHATFAKDILESQRAFVAYSQFPAGGPMFEYPSLFDLSVALLVAGSGADLLLIVEVYVVILAVLSPIVMWRFLRRFFGGGPRDAFIAVAFVALNWFVLAKTVRDGSYGELLAAGVMFPLWLSFLWDRRDLLAAGTLFAIVLTHNLTALLAFGTFVALLLYYALERQWTRIRRTVITHGAILGITAIILWPVYASYLFPVTSGIAGGFPVIDLFSYTVIISPVLFVIGGLGLGLVVRRSPGQFAGLWAAAYAALSRTSFASERIAREMSIPFAVGAAGLVIGLVGADRTGRIARRGRRVLPLAVVVVLTAANGLWGLASNTDPAALHYLEPYQLEAYRWLSSHSNSSEAVLALASVDPFLSVFVPNDVFPVVNLHQADRLSKPDRDMDIALVQALFNYTDTGLRGVFSANRIHWVVLSSPFPSPTWIAPEDIPFIQQAWDLRLDSDPGFMLRYSVTDVHGSAIRVFEIISSGGAGP